METEQTLSPILSMKELRAVLWFHTNPARQVRLRNSSFHLPSCPVHFVAEKRMQTLVNIQASYQPRNGFLKVFTAYYYVHPQSNPPYFIDRNNKSFFPILWPKHSFLSIKSNHFRPGPLRLFQCMCTSVQGRFHHPVFYQITSAFPTELVFPVVPSFRGSGGGCCEIRYPSRRMYMPTKHRFIHIPIAAIFHSLQPL